MDKVKVFGMIPNSDAKVTECAIHLRKLVLCKDCKKHGDIACPLWTDDGEFETDDDWFCADGESK